MKSLKLATFNVRHFSTGKLDEVDYPAFIQTIRNLDADLVGINESYGPESRFGEKAQVQVIAEALGWNWFFAPAVQVPGWGIYGNSILTRLPIKKTECIPIPDPVRQPQYKHYESRCILLAEVEVEKDLWTIAVTHFGLNPDEQDMALMTVQNLMKSERFVLMGDLNVTPDAPILDPIRENLVDSVSWLKENQLSFPSDKPDRKIDYIFVSPDIQVISADIPEITVSDHRPYIAEVKLS